MATRTHIAEVVIDHWRGTLGDVLGLVTSADVEIKRHHENVAHLIRVTYDDGSHVFETIKEFANQAAVIDSRKIINVEASVWSGWSDETTAVTLRFGWAGAEVSAESTDQVWAHGVAELLGERLAKGEQPEYEPSKKPFTRLDWLAAALQSLLLVGAVVVAVVLNAGVSVDLALVGVAFGPQMVIAMLYTDRRVRNPPVRFVALGAPAPVPAKEAGLPIKMQEWVRERPLINLVFGILIGIGVNKLSDLL